MTTPTRGYLHEVRVDVYKGQILSVVVVSKFNSRSCRNYKGKVVGAVLGTVEVSSHGSLRPFILDLFPSTSFTTVGIIITVKEI